MRGHGVAVVGSTIPFAVGRSIYLEVNARVQTQAMMLGGKITYVFACLAFKRVYAGHGISADSVKRRKLGIFTKLLIYLGLSVHARFFRRRVMPMKVPV